jgi:hypothetical protein
MDLAKLQIEEAMELPGGYVKRKGRDCYVLSDDNNHYRKRWGTLEEITGDIIFFLDNGCLPKQKEPMW